MIPFPDKKYDIIYADPPWTYREALYNPFRKRLSPSKAEHHYQTMSITDLEKLPVETIANKDCLLFLWVSNPNLPDCIKVGMAWGFKFATVAFIWDKQRTNPGNYTMSQCEQCLVFKKGKIPQPRGKRNILQFLSVKRGKHSVKPYEVRHRITEMFPEQSKIELFARQHFDGWDVWGNEV